jgi:hypothetical protein
MVLDYNYIIKNMANTTASPSTAGNVGTVLPVGSEWVPRLYRQCLYRLPYRLLAVKRTGTVITTNQKAAHTA